MSNSLMHFSFNGNQVRVVMRDGEPWWLADEVTHLVTDLPKKLPPFLGCVYAVEYGGLLKIGRTTNPKARFVSLASLARNYGPGHVGRVVLSRLHTNYAANERLLHATFAAERKTGELFAISIERFLDVVGSLELQDDSAKRQETADAVLQFIKEFITGERRIP